MRSVREECLDPILILNENHLRRVLKEYGEYYNHARPHQGISQHFPVSGPVRSTKGQVRRRDVLGGVIHDYYRQPSAPISGTVQDFYCPIQGYQNLSDHVLKMSFKLYFPLSDRAD